MTVTADLEEIIDEKHIVTFKVQDQVYAQIQIANGSVIGNDLPVSPLLQGYIFKGWKDELGNSVTSATAVTADMTVTADLEEIVEDKHIVTFKVQDQVYTQIQIADGGVVGNNLPAAPMLEGYIFKNWKDELGNIVTSETVVTGDMIVTAELEEIPAPVKYLVTFKVLDQVYAEIQIADGSMIGNDLPASPILVEYVFKNWKDELGNIVTSETVVTGDMIVVAELELIPPEIHTHTWDAGIVVKSATCDEDGVMLYTCSSCGDTKTEAIPATGHTYGEWVLEDEDNHKKECSCGDAVREAHTWDAGVVTVAPTTTTEGIKTYTCTICNGTKTEVIEKLPDPTRLPTITVGDASAKAGKEVTIPVSISNNPGLVGLILEFSYDSTVLTLTGYEQGNTFGNWEFTKPGDITANPIRFLWDGTDADSTNGNLLFLKFAVADDAILGDYLIDVTVKAASNQDLEDVEITEVDGKVTVDGREPELYTVTFKVQDQVYTEIQVTENETIGTNLPASPTLEDYIFKGWKDELGNSVTEDTVVTGDMTVVAELAIKVTFFEGYGKYADEIVEVELMLDADGKATIPASDIPSDSLPWDGYEKSDYMPSDYEDYTGKHEVEPEFWYLDNGEFKLFDENVVLTKNTDVHWMYKELSVNAFGISVVVRYDEDSRVMDSLKAFIDKAIPLLETAKESGEPTYEKLTSKILEALEATGLVDENKFIKTITFPLALSNALRESDVQRVINNRITNIQNNISNPGYVDTLLSWPGVKEYLIAKGISISDETAIIDHVRGLADVSGIKNAIYATSEYINVIDAIKNNGDFDVIGTNLELLKAIREELQIITFDTVMDKGSGSAIANMVSVVGYDVCKDIFDGGREDYCDELASLITDVENGTVPSGTIASEFDLKFDPIEDILVPLYDKAEQKVIDEFGASVRYDENPYLQYLVEDHDIFAELFNKVDAGNDERTGYQLKDMISYAEYLNKLLIATDDALCWYGELDDADFEAVYEAVFAKMYEVHDRIDGIISDFYYDDKLPDIVDKALSSVKQANDIFLSIAPTLKKLIGTYLGSGIYDDMVDGTLGDKENIKDNVDIITGKETPVLTIDGLFEKLLNNEETIKARLQSLLDSGSIDEVVNKLKNSSIGQKIGTQVIDDIIGIIENIAANGFEDYKVDTTDITDVDKYEFKIGDETITISRYFVF